MVRVWVATLLDADVRRRRWLDDRELHRLGRYESPGDQARFLLGAALLRSVLGQELGLPPGEVPLDRTCPTCGRGHGRPRVPQPGLTLSVTHSGLLVAVAVARDTEVGIDVEPVRSGDRDATRSWTETEARLKAGGDPALVVRQLAAPLPAYVLSLATWPEAPVEVHPAAAVLSGRQVGGHSAGARAAGSP